MATSETVYPVNDLYPTLQGEGVLSGVPMILLRLHGCPVGCPFCDTKETWTLNPADERLTLAEVRGANALWANLSPDVIVAEVQKTRRDAHSAAQWVLLTGGEPALYALRPLVGALQDAGYKVALETSGTQTGHLGAGCDWVCVSPKMNMPGGLTIDPLVVMSAHEIKFVIGAEKDLHRAEGLLAAVPRREDQTICLQPMSQSDKATELCITECQKRGWRLSLQSHKYISIA